MRPTLGIYGSGGLGREILVLANHIKALSRRWRQIIFIDDGSKAAAVSGIRVQSFDTAIGEFTTETLEISIGVGEPSVRSMLAEKVIQRGFRLATLVHPQVHIPSDTNLGLGCTVCVGCFVSCGVSIAENVLLQPNSSVGHDCRVGAHSVISTFASLAGNCVVGDRTYIGMNTPVKEKIILGDDVIVGMGSVVVRDIESGMIALGNPARPISRNEEKRVFKK